MCVNSLCRLLLCVSRTAGYGTGSVQGDEGNVAKGVIVGDKQKEVEC